MKGAPHRFTLRQLQYVVAVADALSFRRAAERCHVSQPSLSMQLAEVEGALGVRLFDRDRKAVVPTAAGREIVERARRLLVDADELDAAAERASDPRAGTVRVGVIPTIAPYLLPAATPALRRELPRLRVAWVEEKTETLMAMLREGSLEGAVLALEAELGDVARERIAVDRFVLVARPEHPLSKKRGPVRQADLLGHEVLLLDEGHCLRDQALEVCGRARESEFRATSLSTLVQMVAGGAGVTLIPEIAVEAETRRAELSVRPVAGPAAHRTLAMVWRRRSSVEPTLRLVTALLREAHEREMARPATKHARSIGRARARA